MSNIIGGSITPGNHRHVDLLLNVANKCREGLCALYEFSTMAVVTGIERFLDDFKNAVGPSLPLYEGKERERYGER
jgi:hypothetical protein